MSTITGTFKDIEGNGEIGTLTFEPMATPIQEGGTLIATTTKAVVTGADGTFSVILEQGYYTATFVPNGDPGKSDIFKVSVPADVASYNFTDRLFTAISTPTGSTPIATNSVTGTVKVNTADGGGDPVVYRVSEIDAFWAAIAGLKVAATLVAAKAIVSVSTLSILLLQGNAAEADGGKGVFAWDDDGTDADDGGLQTIRPDDYVAYGNKGNWKRIV